MKKIMWIIFCLLFLTATTTGCWNLREPNQRAFIIGVGMDMTEDKELEISSEIAVPAGLGSSQVTGAGKKNTFTVVSAKGKDFMDAGQHMQAELSRSLFYAHRQTILIGQHMAEEGVDTYLDMVVRNPKSEIRSVVLVVKDGTAKEVIKAEPTFDPFISTTLGSQQNALGMKPYYFRMLLCDAFSEGTQPIVPAIKADPDRGYVYTGSAILNKDHGLKLVGFLDPEESMYDNWMMGRQKNLTFTTLIGKENKTISLAVQSLKHRTHIKMVKNKPQIYISLQGTGSIVENNTSLDPSKENDLKTIQTRLSQEAEEKVRKLVDKAQHQYKIDIFGIGEQVHRQHPEVWKTLKPHWHKTFPELPITVSVHLRYRDPGQTNSSL
ncbi:Ger(x)C family spore germination protein [Paenibacillus favisporus]|uniref:Ger(x)C family spore germination protein n=1 Tax=Paenibacillus favisporus TaxID=221028 RepID=UPI0013D3BA1D|nr:Ger(x)C family spore germination protein [Paenibacillus favisporus]